MAKEMDKAPTFLQMEGNGLVSGVTICKMDLDAINSSTGKPLKVSGWMESKRTKCERDRCRIEKHSYFLFIFSILEILLVFK